MKKLVFVLIFFIIISYANAQNISNMNFDEINVDVKINSGVNIEHLSNSYDIEYIFANLTFFPKEDEWQKIISRNFVYDDQLNENENYIYIRWEDPSEDKLDFNLDFNVNSKFKFEHVKNKVVFPIDENELPEDVKPYLEDTETINSNDIKIIEQATTIAEGKDDLYQVVFDMGNWVKENIKYDLNTLTEDAQQNARWVLDHKEGVCDEITVLFVAMLRSIGIPAKFVSGSTYSNTINGFGNHAWAEVYFPGEGWVSFDVTYGQFGYIDASHIKFKESLDAKEPSISYGWKSDNVDVTFDPLNVESELIFNGENLDKKVELSVNLLTNQVKAGSYVPVEIKIKNLENYYLPLTIYLTKAASNIEDNTKVILLKPNQEKSVFWILQVPSDIDSNYVYTSTIEFIDYFGSSDSEGLEYGNNYDYYSLEEAEDKISQLEEISESNPNNNLEFICKLGKETWYTYEKGNVSCYLKNKGNINLDNLGVCFLEDCQNINLLINMEKNINFEFDTNLESREYYVVAKNDELTKYYYIDINIVESPNLKFENLTYPLNIKYTELGEIKFNLNSDSEGYDVVIKLGNKEIFRIDKFHGQESFLIPFEGSFFYKDKKLIIEYKDNNDKEYLVEEDLNINVTNAPFYIKILDFFGLV